MEGTRGQGRRLRLLLATLVALAAVGVSGTIALAKGFPDVHRGDW